MCLDPEELKKYKLQEERNTFLNLKSEKNVKKVSKLFYFCNLK